MSVFSPYTTYKVAYPALKPGYIIKIADRFYIVITVRNNRPTIAITGAKATKYTLDLSNSSTFEQLHGELKKNRIVHLQYLAIDTGNTPNLYWGTEPLLSKDVDGTISTTVAGLTNPIGIDRWSYDPAMRLAIIQTATQNYYFEILEYEVVPYEGTPTKPYLQIFANGQAILIESESVEKSLQLIALKRNKRQED